MIFRKAAETEGKTVLSLYRSVIGMPFCAWDESYPGETEILQDLSSGTLYVLEENAELIGAISIVPENELDDAGCWAVRENAWEFARVVIRPDCQKRGLSARLVEGILRELTARHAAAVHLAVAKQNIPAQRLYQRMGFSFCGEADMFGHSYFLCERNLESGESA